MLGAIALEACGFAEPQQYSIFVFLINFLKFIEFVFHLEVVGYDV